MKTYRVNSNPKSFQGILRQFQTELYRENKEKIERLVARLAELGANKVSVELNSSTLSGSGTYTATLEPTSNGYKIVATGDNVIMAEFGTGDDVEQFDTLDVGAEIVRPGSWSETHGKQYSTNGFWHYRGTKYTGEKGVHAFYFAKQDMISAIEKIANEVFND